MDNKKEKNYSGVSGTLVTSVNEGYEAKVGYEALNRTGNNIQLKGIVHEVMYKDRLNIEISNIVSGKKAYLSQHTNAVRDDIIVKQGNKIVDRYQLKDTISRSGISDTIKKVTNHQYSGTKLAGTEETKKLYNQTVDKLLKKGKNVTQEMSSTGISSYDTKRIADKALGNCSSLKDTVNLNTLKTTANTGAISAAIQAALSASDLINDRISVDAYASNVVKEGAKGAASQFAINTVGTQVCSSVTRTLASKGASTAIKTIGGGMATLGTGLVAGALVEAGIRTASDNGKDFVENTIDVVFEPLEAIGGFFDSLFGW